MPHGRGSCEDRLGCDPPTQRARIVEAVARWSCSQNEQATPPPSRPSDAAAVSSKRRRRRRARSRVRSHGLAATASRYSGPGRAGPDRVRRMSRQTRGMLTVGPRAVAGFGAATARRPWTPPARPSPVRRWSQTPPQSERARRVGRPGRRGAERRRRRRTAGTGAPAPRGGVGKARALSPPSAGSRLSAVEGWLSQRRSERRRDENVHTAGITASAR